MKKPMIFRINILVFSLLFVLFPYVNSAQSSTIPEDTILIPNFRYGKLSNGLTYYIKSIESKQPELDLRLITKVGNKTEDKNQVEIAHILEHLAFKESTNFPTGIYNDEGLFEKFGMSLTDVTAYIQTSFTQYIFKAPADKAEALDAGFLWFKDIATGLKLSKKDVDSENGTVRQELIVREGKELNSFFFRTKLHSKLFPCKNNYSNYFDQNPLTQTELKTFYKTWYRPDLMAISIVGNINDLDQIENQVKEKFSDIPLPATHAKNLECDSLYNARELQFVIEEKKSDSLRKITDQTVNIQLYFRKKEIGNLDDSEKLKRTIMANMLNQILNQRFRELENSYNATYEITTHTNKKSAPKFFMDVTISARKSSEKTALKNLFKTFKQISSEGVLPEEWEKAKGNYIKNFENVDTAGSRHWVDQFKGNFIYDDKIISEDKNSIKKWISNLSLAEFNQIIQGLISPMPEDIGIIAPSDNEALSYTEKEIRSLISDSFSKEAKSYKPPLAPNALMAKEEVEKLEIEPYVNQKIGETGAIEVKLSNGVRLIFKSYMPSPGMNSKDVILHGFSNKGASSIPDKEKQLAALNAPMYVRHSGVRDLDFFDLKRYLSNTSLKQGVFPYIDYRETGIEGKAELNDFEKMLQLVYLYFTEPRKDKIAFKDWKEQAYEAYLNPTYSVGTVDFNDFIDFYLGDNLLTPRGTKRFESIDKTNFELGFKAYQKFFGNAKDFTFLISGNFPLEPVLPLAQKYLGNLPNQEKITPEENRGLLSSSLPLQDGIEEISKPIYYNLKNTLYGLCFVKKAANKTDWQEQIKVEALGAITNAFSWDLRFEKGFSIYDWGGRGKFNKEMLQYELSFNIHCSPEEFPRIRKEFKKMISKIKLGNIPEKHLRNGLQRMYQIYSTEGRGNEQREIMPHLYEHYRFNMPWVDPEIKEKFVKSLTLEDIITTAEKYYTKENLYEFVRGIRN